MAENLNPHDLRDGEVLPMIGGPYDGASRSVSVLMPDFFGGIPCHALSVGSACYALNQERRRWEYMPPTFKTIDCTEEQTNG